MPVSVIEMEKMHWSEPDEAVIGSFFAEAESLSDQELLDLHTGLLGETLDPSYTHGLFGRLLVGEYIVGSLVCDVTRVAESMRVSDAEGRNPESFRRGERVLELHFSPYGENKPSDYGAIRMAALYLGVSDMVRFIGIARKSVTSGEWPDKVRTFTHQGMLPFVRRLGLHTSAPVSGPYWTRFGRIAGRLGLSGHDSFIGHIVYGRMTEVTAHEQELREDLARLQEIAKVRYPNLNERTARISAISKLLLLRDGAESED